ncbi:MAG: hypothetical protein ABSE69_09445 [Roseiarcus sp.]|jgi:hypothetical protein
MKAQFQSAAEARAEEASRSLTSASLAPVLAGARARGMADALELLGVAAVLIDECGFALHINDRARSLLGAQLSIDDGRLRAAKIDLDEAIGAALESALSAVTPARAVANICFAADSRGAAAVKVLPIVAEPDDPFQLLRAIVIIEQRGASNNGGFDVLN